MTVIWPGTPEEGSELLSAISHHCDCTMLPTLKKCTSHSAMVNDQQWVNRLVFFRRLRAVLLKEEQVDGP